MSKNKVIEKLKKNEVVSVINCGYFQSPQLVEIAGRIGFDCVWFDMEHRSFGYRELSDMAVACRATGMEAMVRLVKGGYTSVMKPLESGATGLMLPHCMSRREAEQYVEWAKYPPAGKRGFDNAGPDGDYLMTDVRKYIAAANDDTFAVAQIEDREAVESIEEIVSVKGIDAVFVGPADLSLSYGIPFEFGSPVIKDAISRVAAASRKHGKAWGIPFGTVEQGKEFVRQGARFMAHGADLTAIVNSFKQYRQAFDNLL